MNLKVYEYNADPCWVKLLLVNLPSINCQPGYVYFELLHYMCGQGSFNAHADRNSSLLSNENELAEAITVLKDQMLRITRSVLKEKKINLLTTISLSNSM